MNNICIFIWTIALFIQGKTFKEMLAVNDYNIINNAAFFSQVSVDR